MRAPRRLWLFLFFLPLVACCACRTTDGEQPPGLPKTTATVTTGDGRTLAIEAEVVASSRGRQRGLMYREELADGEGMLFLFDREEEHPFWMKNTKIPLDMIVFDSQHHIVGFVHEAAPFKEDSLTVGLPSRFVLEVPGGYCKRQSIHRGDRVDFAL